MVIPELSIVIVSYQCKQYLLDLLADLETARADVAVEVQLIDNASNDGTPEAVRQMYPWVALTALNENLGFSRANNLAIPNVRAPTVLLLNPDTRVTGTALRACVDEMVRSPNIGVLTPRVVDEHGTFDRRCMRGFPTLWGVFCHVSRLDRVLRGRRARRYTMGWLPDDQAADVESVSGAAMFVRADALRQADGFDERFFMYGEDIDLCVRIADAGWQIHYWPGAEITHLGGRTPANVRSERAWAVSLGELQRAHRRGHEGLFAGAVFDAIGAAMRRHRSFRTRRVPPQHSG